MTLAMLVSTLLNCVFQQIITLYNTKTPPRGGVFAILSLGSNIFCVSNSNVLADSFVGFGNAFLCKKSVHFCVCAFSKNHFADKEHFFVMVSPFLLLPRQMVHQLAIGGFLPDALLVQHNVGSATIPWQAN